MGFVWMLVFHKLTFMFVAVFQDLSNSLDKLSFAFIGKKSKYSPSCIKLESPFKVFWIFLYKHCW